MPVTYFGVFGFLCVGASSYKIDLRYIANGHLSRFECHGVVFRAHFKADIELTKALETV